SRQVFIVCRYFGTLLRCISEREWDSPWLLEWMEGLLPFRIASHGDNNAGDFELGERLPSRPTTRPSLLGTRNPANRLNRFFLHCLLCFFRTTCFASVALFGNPLSIVGGVASRTGWCQHIDHCGHVSNNLGCCSRAGSICGPGPDSGPIAATS